MNEHDHYMADFMMVYQTLERWSPGTDVDSFKALLLLPIMPKNIIDIGCGKGFSTSLLAKQTDAQIIAVDNEQSALDELGERLAQQQLDKQVTLTCASMTELPFTPSSFDLIWSEGSAYIMGVEQALKQWQPLLKANGCMVISDLVWLTDNPSPAATEFWQQEYPDMQTIDKRLAQMQQAGVVLINHFTAHQSLT
jgi:cyclopropane fatty-acyl-phospholipid synthase-like methyltransferase